MHSQFDYLTCERQCSGVGVVPLKATGCAGTPIGCTAENCRKARGQRIAAQVALTMVCNCA
eukprot:3702128-Amphidinium_carterae.1